MTIAIYLFNGRLSPIKTTPFLERQVQTITESNLEIIFGLQLICSEFSLVKSELILLHLILKPLLLCLLNTKRISPSALSIAGYAYLSTMLNHKAEFILIYNEATVNFLGKSDFDWSQSRVVFISPSFTEHQREAARFKDLPLELYQVHLYSNDTIGYSMVNQSQGTASVRTVSKTNKAIAKVISEIDVYTEERLLDARDEDVRQAYWAIRDIIQQINPDVEARVKKSMVCYYADGRGLAWVSPANKRITLYLRKGVYDNRYGKLIPEGWGKYPELRLSAHDLDLLYIRDLLQQANTKCYERKCQLDR